MKKVLSLYLVQSLGLVVGLSIFAASPLFALEETDREITQTYVNFFLKQNRIAEAERKLEEHLKGDATDHVRWDLLGTLRLKSGQHDAALAAFNAAIQADPVTQNQGTYLYHRADAQIRKGDKAGATQSLKQASKYSLVKEPSNNALKKLTSGQALQALDSKGSGSNDWELDWKVSLRGGYDTNVLLLSDQSLQTISRSETDSSFFAFGSALSLTRPVQKSTFETKLRNSFLYFPEDGVDQYNMISNGLDLRWTSEKGKFYSSFFSFTNLTFLNTDSYEFYTVSENLGLDLHYEPNARLRSTITLPIRYQKFATTALSAAASDRSGFAVSPSFTQAVRFGQTLLSIGFNFDRTVANGTNARLNAYRIPLAVAQILPFQIQAIAQSRYTYQYYTDGNLRRDHQIESMVALRRTFYKNFAGGLSYTFLKSISNQTASDYDRHIGGAEIEYKIF